MTKEPVSSSPESGNDGGVESLETLTPGQKEFLAEAEKRGVPKKLFGEHIPEVQFQEDQPNATKPTVALINTGGTLMMVPSKKEPSALSFHDATAVPRVIEVMHSVSNIKDAMNIIGIDLGSIDSKDADIQIWQAIAAIIQTIYDRVTGVVVGHGTNTLEYSAPAVAYALQQLCMPVVFTAAQLPVLGYSGSDGLPNLAGAMHIAAHGDVAEVIAYAHGEIHRATRVEKVNDNRLAFLESQVTGPIGYFGASGIELKPGVRRRTGKRHFELRFLPEFNPHVTVIRLQPAMDAKIIDRMCTGQDEAGVVLETFGSGAVPRRLVEPIAEHIRQGIPVYVSSSCGQSGISDGMHLRDEDAQIAHEAGIRDVRDMSTPAAAVKLMHVLAHIPRGSKDNIQAWLHAIREEMTGKSYAGEITLPDEADPY